MFGLVSKKEYDEIYTALKISEAKNIKFQEEIKDLKAELSRTIMEATVKVRKTTNKDSKKTTTKKVATKKAATKKTTTKKKEVK